MKTSNTLKTIQLILTAVAVSGLCLATGCGKKEASPPAPAPGVSAEVQTTLTQLTEAARKYNVEKRQPPMSLQDVVAAGYLKEIPAAPPGKKFVLNPRLVVVTLADQ
jgi:hypothetical protein